MSSQAANKSGRRRRSDVGVAAADVIEAVFGPDPGLLRFRMAARTLISAGATLGALLLLLGGASLQAIAAIMLGFMSCLFSNIAVRDPHIRQQAVTLSLLPLPTLGSVAVASYLSAWPWASDLGFIVVVMAAAAARSFGPRGMALGMVAFIAYFVGVILKPPLTDMPNLAIAVAIGIGAAAAVRLALLPDRPRAALVHMQRYIYRRLERLIRLADEMLASDPGERAGETHVSLRRARAEIARLQDALLAAQEQLEFAPGGGPAARAERAVRAGPRCGASRQNCGAGATRRASRRASRAARPRRGTAEGRRRGALPRCPSPAGKIRRGD